MPHEDMRPCVLCLIQEPYMLVGILGEKDILVSMGFEASYLIFFVYIPQECCDSETRKRYDTECVSTLQKDGWVPPLTQTPGTPALALLALALLALAFPACKANLGKKGR